ncbi:MAG: hypothetical protein ABI972_09880 [Acidobacteriota bacterium]
MDALFTQPYLIAAVVAFGVAVAGVILLTHSRLRSASSQPNINWKQIQSFQGDYYRPLERLLAPEDYQFLQRQPGYQPALADKLRKERRKIFRGYLVRLEREFHQLHRLARTLVRDQEQDRPELAMALLKTDAQFRWNLIRIKIQLHLQAAHLNIAVLQPADARGLVDAAIWMQAQIRLLHEPMAAGAAA